MELLREKKDRISDETIDYLGGLAKLELMEEERKHLKKEIGELLDYIDMLQTLDTEGIAPMSHVFSVNNVFREDVVTNGNGQKESLYNAPKIKGEYFNVPKTRL